MEPADRRQNDSLQQNREGLNPTSNRQGLIPNLQQPNAAFVQGLGAGGSANNVQSGQHDKLKAEMLAMMYYQSAAALNSSHISQHTLQGTRGSQPIGHVENDGNKYRQDTESTGHQQDPCASCRYKTGPCESGHGACQVDSQSHSASSVETPASSRSLKNSLSELLSDDDPTPAVTQTTTPEHPALTLQPQLQMEKPLETTHEPLGTDVFSDSKTEHPEGTKPAATDEAMPISKDIGTTMEKPKKKKKKKAKVNELGMPNPQLPFPPGMPFAMRPPWMVPGMSNDQSLAANSQHLPWMTPGMPPMPEMPASLSQSMPFLAGMQMAASSMPSMNTPQSTVAPQTSEQRQQPCSLSTSSTAVQGSPNVPPGIDVKSSLNSQLSSPTPQANTSSSVRHPPYAAQSMMSAATNGSSSLVQSPFVSSASTSVGDHSTQNQLSSGTPNFSPSNPNCSATYTTSVSVVTPSSSYHSPNVQFSPTEPTTFKKEQSPFSTPLDLSNHPTPTRSAMVQASPQAPPPQPSPGGSRVGMVTDAAQPVMEHMGDGRFQSTSAAPLGLLGQNVLDMINENRANNTEQSQKEVDLSDRLRANQMEQIPNCCCLGPNESYNESKEGAYYTHLGAGPTIPAVREMMENRLSVKGKELRIEKIMYTGVEGKSPQGCPIAKWVLRRSSYSEKVLVIVRRRPGHHCETAVLVCSIVVWDGVPQTQATELYDFAAATLPKYGFETERRCGANEQKTCACQGWNGETGGASFSFGCSWSMYYNGCKFAKSSSPRKFKLKNEAAEPTLEHLLQTLATDLAPLYKSAAPDSYRNMTEFENIASECRLGYRPGRPFSGVTSVVDFCAHAHKDQQNMNNGCTVVVTLTKHRGLSRPDDEQLHVLPLCVLDPTDEHGSAKNQYAKIQSGAIDWLTKYPMMMRIRSTPRLSKKKREAIRKALNKGLPMPNIRGRGRGRGGRGGRGRGSSSLGGRGAMYNKGASRLAPGASAGYNAWKSPWKSNVVGKAPTTVKRVFRGPDGKKYKATEDGRIVRLKPKSQKAKKKEGDPTGVVKQEMLPPGGQLPFPNPIGQLPMTSMSSMGPVPMPPPLGHMTGLSPMNQLPADMMKAFEANKTNPGRQSAMLPMPPHPAFPPIPPQMAMQQHPIQQVGQDKVQTSSIDTVMSARVNTMPPGADTTHSTGKSPQGPGNIPNTCGDLSNWYNKWAKSVGVPTVPPSTPLGTQAMPAGVPGQFDNAPSPFEGPPNKTVGKGFPASSQLPDLPKQPGKSSEFVWPQIPGMPQLSDLKTGMRQFQNRGNSSSSDTVTVTNPFETSQPMSTDMVGPPNIDIGAMNFSRHSANDRYPMPSPVTHRSPSFGESRLMTPGSGHSSPLITAHNAYLGQSPSPYNTPERLPTNAPFNNSHSYPGSAGQTSLPAHDHQRSDPMSPFVSPDRVISRPPSAHSRPSSRQSLQPPTSPYCGTPDRPASRASTVPGNPTPSPSPYMPAVGYSPSQSPHSIPSQSPLPSPSLPNHAVATQGFKPFSNVEDLNKSGAGSNLSPFPRPEKSAPCYRSNKAGQNATEDNDPYAFPQLDGCSDSRSGDMEYSHERAPQGGMQFSGHTYQPPQHNTQGYQHHPQYQVPQGYPPMMPPPMGLSHAMGSTLGATPGTPSHNSQGLYAAGLTAPTQPTMGLSNRPMNISTQGPEKQAAAFSQGQSNTSALDMLSETVSMQPKLNPNQGVHTGGNLHQPMSGYPTKVEPGANVPIGMPNIHQGISEHNIANQPNVLKERNLCKDTQWSNSNIPPGQMVTTPNQHPANLKSGGFNEAPPAEEPKEPTPCDREEATDCADNFKENNIGGVAIALTHGSVLFECAKRELHATTAVKNPNRASPTRISLVFYQHKNLNHPNHGHGEYEKKCEVWQERRLQKIRDEEKALALKEGKAEPALPNTMNQEKGSLMSFPPVPGPFSEIPGQFPGLPPWAGEQKFIAEVKQRKDDLDFKSPHAPMVYDSELMKNVPGSKSGMQQKIRDKLMQHKSFGASDNAQDTTLSQPRGDLYRPQHFSPHDMAKLVQSQPSMGDISKVSQPIPASAGYLTSKPAPAQAMHSGMLPPLTIPPATKPVPSMRSPVTNMSPNSRHSQSPASQGSQPSPTEHQMSLGSTQGHSIIHTAQKVGGGDNVAGMNKIQYLLNQYHQSVSTDASNPSHQQKSCQTKQSKSHARKRKDRPWDQGTSGGVPQVGAQVPPSPNFSNHMTSPSQAGVTQSLPNPLATGQMLPGLPAIVSRTPSQERKSLDQNLHGHMASQPLTSLHQQGMMPTSQGNPTLHQQAVNLQTGSVPAQSSGLPGSGTTQPSSWTNYSGPKTSLPGHMVNPGQLGTSLPIPVSSATTPGPTGLAPTPAPPPEYKWQWDTTVQNASTGTTTTLSVQWIQPKLAITGPYLRWK